MLLRWIFFFVLISLIEIYSFQAIRTLMKLKWMRQLYLILSFVVWIYLSFEFAQFDRSVGQNRQTLFALGLLLIIFLPKFILAFFMFIEDLYRIIAGMFSFLYTKLFTKSENRGFLPGRRRFVSQVSLALAAIPFSSLLYGVTKGKYNFKVIRQTIYFPDLPQDFDGFTITQISDLHSGSFDDPEKINHAIDLINQQNSEMILFTGDIVNTHADEMLPWIDSFNRINKPAFGKFSVLGNHDYGEYIDWPTEEAKLYNFNAIKALHDKIGFQLLLNENVKIKKGKGEIFLVGVENWGKSFRKAGDVNLATIGLKKEDFKVLMTHDPSHWEYEVKNHDKNFQLSLSGHTHGLQFGVEIPGLIKWSPVQYVYEQWAGLYENLGRYIYVNRGFGFHAYPGRVGIWPEITVLELKKGNLVA